MFILRCPLLSVSVCLQNSWSLNSSWMSQVTNANIMYYPPSRQVICFLVPSRALVIQQADYLRRNCLDKQGRALNIAGEIQTMNIRVFAFAFSSTYRQKSRKHPIQIIITSSSLPSIVFIFSAPDPLPISFSHPHFLISSSSPFPLLFSFLPHFRLSHSFPFPPPLLLSPSFFPLTPILLSP